MEPLNQDSLKSGHLDIEDGFCRPKYYTFVYVLTPEIRTLFGTVFTVMSLTVDSRF